MAQDGRIAEVNTEEKEDSEYEIEEKDKPEVDKAEVKVVHAADGVNVMPEEDAPEAPATPETYYGYTWKINPDTNRYEMVPVDPTTGTEVTSEDYDQARSTRYAPEAVIGSEVYGRGLGEETQECPEGFVYDEEVGACVEDVSVGMGTVGDSSGDSPSVDTPRVDYASQGLTKLAEALGPLSAEDLEGVEGETLSDKAITRMTTPATPVTPSLNPFAMGLSLVQNIYDDVGARRAALTREAEFTRMANQMPSTGEPATLGIKAYNWNFNPGTGSFNPSRASSAVTQVQQKEGGGSWVTDFNHVGAKGKEYTQSSLGSQDEDGWSWNPVAADDIIDAIENDYKNMTAVTGGGSKNMYGDNEGTDSSPTSSGGSRTTDAADVDSGRGGMGPSGSGPSDAGMSDEDAESAAAAGDFGGFAKGGYVTKQNKPKVAAMKYSKGSK